MSLNERLIEVEIPSFVYRVDSRPPLIDGDLNGGIFRNGFKSWGNCYMLTNHVKGGFMLEKTGYIPTSSNYDAAMKILRSAIYGHNAIVGNHGNLKVSTYLYTIKPSPSNFISVVENLPNDDFFEAYKGQYEWLAIDRIDPQNIHSCLMYEMELVNGIRKYDTPNLVCGFSNENFKMFHDSRLPGYHPEDFHKEKIGRTASHPERQEDSKKCDPNY
ncbi:hypothetical protein HZP42_00910 [Elizabethkingia anophelis]|uniref:hypothetical protein n=1 Tax=Elizabethkingia anophelis TaxID=1117645 RepID=UPI00099A1073|nr:hypothetical protein [Elizabethkingia anophelis]MCT4234936.1 hypothetical protein [Elizabethkingia anophelis]OPC30706.1 hypothetical protein BAX98_08840 [Elizabethkingia anophelis]